MFEGGGNGGGFIGSKSQPVADSVSWGYGVRYPGVLCSRFSVWPIRAWGSYAPVLIDARLRPSGPKLLHYFSASPVWDDKLPWTALWLEVDRLVAGPDASLVIDDTALLKKGARPFGATRQYRGSFGKAANCESRVSLT